MEGLRLKKVLTHDRYSISTKSTDQFNTEEKYNNILIIFLVLIQRHTGTLYCTYHYNDIVYLESRHGYCIQYVSM